MEAQVLEVSSAPGTAPAGAGGCLDEALDALFSLCHSVLPARRGSLYLCADGTNALMLFRANGLTVSAETACIPLDGTVAGVVVRSRVPLLVRNVEAYPALPAHPERYATPSFLSVPILVENDGVGVLNAADRPDGQPFSEEDLSNAERLTRCIAAVLYSDLLVRRALDAGEVDPATGLYNSRHFEKRLAQEVERAHRTRSPLTLLLIGVSGYADLAARVSVQTAGVLMRRVGEMVGRTVRQSDVLVRRSDAEIAVLLSATALDRARRVARVIAREIAHERLPAQLRYDLETLPMGIGMASLALGMDSADLVRRAEEALARARAGGEEIVAASDDKFVEISRRTPPRATEQHAISTALRLGIPYLANPTDAATSSALQLFSVEIARANLCFPVAFEAGTLTLAMADPTDAGAIQAVSQVTAMAIYPVISPREKILQAIATMMGLHEQPFPGSGPAD